MANCQTPQIHCADGGYVQALCFEGGCYSACHCYYTGNCAGYIRYNFCINEYECNVVCCNIDTA